jgi:magnesium transporter
MQFELTKEYIDNLKEIIKNKDEQQAQWLMGELYPADIAEIYVNLTIEEAKYLFLLLYDEIAADVLAELEYDDREKFLKALPAHVIAKKFIDEMDSDDAADVLNDLPDEVKEEVLQNLSDSEQAGDIVDLLSYNEDTAGGLMAKELIKVHLDWNIKTCIKELARQAKDVDEVYYVYVVDEDNVLHGTLSLKKLLISHEGAQIGEIYNPEIISIKADTPSEEVANIMEKYDLVALPVTDTIGRLLGRITIDDVIDVMREEADKDYQMASGISQDVESTDSVWLLTRARFPWLLIGLVGGILGSLVIGVFEAEIAQYAAMAFFIPLIAAMGGNVGVQSAAIVVQGLASNTLGIESTLQKIMKELSVALINALSLSLLVFIYNMIFSDSFALTLAVSISLFIVIVFASIFGTFVPLTLNRFKIDPALATGPFITTMNDILGLFIYMYTAKIIFEMYN